MTDLHNKSRTKIYILEDDLWYSQFLFYHFSLNPNHEVQVFNSVESFLKSLPEAPNIVTMDYHLLGVSGELVFNKILENSPATYILAVSGQEDTIEAANLIKRGAYDYIVKNSETKERLGSIVEKIKQNVSLKQEIEELRREIKQRHTLGKEIVGTSPAMQQAFRLAEEAAGNNINVFISGEEGTGKNLIAKAIHLHSNRSARPFVALNLNEYPADIQERELFGFEEGVFTGALKFHTGKLEDADGGTLFLDNIDKLNLYLQSRLLNLLQEKAIARPGAGRSVPIDVRLITATHQYLPDLVKKGNFREDLYFLLLGIRIHLPPLRERGPDLPLIANKILRDFCRLNEMPVKTLSADAHKKLMQYPYPQNINELKSTVELAAILSSDRDVVTPEFIQLPNTMEPTIQEEKTLDEYLADIVQKSLDKYNYNVLHVANKLNIGKSTIYRMIRKKEVVVRRMKLMMKNSPKR